MPELLNWKSNCIKIAIAAANHRLQTASERTAAEKQAVRPDTRGIIWCLTNPDRIETVYPQALHELSSQASLQQIKGTRYLCYTVDVEIRKETVKYKIMGCDCCGVQEVAKRPAGISGSLLYTETA